MGQGAEVILLIYWYVFACAYFYAL